MSDPAPLMAGKTGVILGIPYDRALAGGIGWAVAGHGAERALTGRRAVRGNGAA